MRPRRSVRARRPTPTARAAAALAILFVAVAAETATASERYDPRLRFRSVRTEHFTIHFHQGEDALASRLAAIAEEVHAQLAPSLDAVGRRRTQVILVDQTDLANGWATPLPYDMIEITAAAPAPSDRIGYTDDWLRLVFTHEYTHVLHLDRSRGVFGALRHVFGRAPLLFPNIYLPAWETEGLATFYETEETGLGRLRSGDFRTIVGAAARAGAFEPIDRATGPLVDWPGGHAAYAYGARFHEYLARRFGPETFARLADATAGRVPYLPGGAYKKVFGQGAQDLWRDFARDAASAATARIDDVPPGYRRLTHHGYIAAGPRWLPGGDLIYSARTPHDFPALMLVPAGGGPPKKLANRYLGEQLSIHGGVVFFDQVDFVRSVALQSDLYALDLDSGRVQRLTGGARAFDPDVAPDGTSLVCAVQSEGRALLVVYPIERRGGTLWLGTPAPLVDEREAQFAAPRWSPDGRRIAAERRRHGALPEVVIVDAASATVVQRVLATVGRVGRPEWGGDSRHLFVEWEQPDEPFNIWRADLGERRVTAALQRTNGARSPAWRAATGRMAYVGYSTDGYDIFEGAPLDGGETTLNLTVVDGDAPPRPTPVTAAGVTGAAAYDPLPTLAPRFWTPVAQTDEDRLEAGAATAGYDALGRHLFATAVRWSDRARPDWDVFYAYDRWRPTLLLSASDDLTVWRDADYRETSVDAAVSLPFRTVLRRQWLYGAFHATREENPGSAFSRRSIRGAYQLATARRYGYSISPEEGVVAGVTGEVTRRALGADADATTISVDVRAYPRFGGRHRVLALRAAAAASWGDREGRQVLGAGGSAAPGSTIVFGRDAIGLARGFATDDVAGYRAVVLNADYRLPFATIERGVGPLPIFIRQVHAALFADVAHAWVDAFDAADARMSAGLELSFDVVLGHYLPLTVSSGVAFRRDPSDASDGAAAFWRLGYAF